MSNEWQCHVNIEIGKLNAQSIVGTKTWGKSKNKCWSMTKWQCMKRMSQHLHKYHLLWGFGFEKCNAKLECTPIGAFSISNHHQSSTVSNKFDASSYEWMFMQLVRHGRDIYFMSWHVCLVLHLSLYLIKTRCGIVPDFKCLLHSKCKCNIVSFTILYCPS